MDYKETWLELKARLERADYEIWKLVDHRTEEKELIKLRGKYEGINVALEYMREVDEDLEG